MSKNELQSVSTREGLGFDPNELREKYRSERDKRWRADGDRRFLAVRDDFAHFGDVDPYASPGYSRPPLDLDVGVLIIGGGWAGLITAARMRGAGLTDLRIVESGADFGGTWYWNRYPGAQCDIESYCYLPLLEETGYMPKEKYSFASVHAWLLQQRGRCTGNGIVRERRLRTRRERVQRVARAMAFAR